MMRNKYPLPWNFEDGEEYNEACESYEDYESEQEERDREEYYNNKYGY